MAAPGQSLPVLTSSGRPELVGFESAVRDSLDQVQRNAQAGATDAETYAPAAPSNWAGAPPSTQDAALDRIAAAVRGLLGSPIP